jgi:hypothetical protein
MNLLKVSLLSLVALVVTASLGSAQNHASEKPNETVAFFQSNDVPELKLNINGEGQQSLRETPREYARCSVIENGKTTFKSVGVKLKGAAGSYRDFDDRPGLTLNFDKYKKGQRYHGMEKLHLNNATQDKTFLSEWLGAEIFRQAGYPAPLVGHVRLWINDRDLGIYVLREGFDDPFLQRSFGSKEGNLYDGGFLQDIDSPLEMDSGSDPDNRQDLVGLALACYHPDPAQRQRMIGDRLDFDKFLSFMALERLCGHWDGYTLNMNNYRIFFPAGRKGVFLPHGMDQLFGDPGAGLYDHATPLVSAAVMQNDELRLKYRQRQTSMAKLLKPIDPWLRQIDARRDKLAALLETIDANLVAAYLDRVSEFKERLVQRSDLLQSLIADGMQSPIEFDAAGEVILIDWYPAVEAENVKVEEVTDAGVACYVVAQEQFGDFSSAWRKQVLLPKGRFRFEARVKTEDVIPIPDGQGCGAGIRVSQSGRSNELVGTSQWTQVTYEIDVPEDQRMVELVLELRARLGKAWFDRESLRLVRTAPVSRTR